MTQGGEAGRWGMSLGIPSHTDTGKVSIVTHADPTHSIGHPPPPSLPACPTSIMTGGWCVCISNPDSTESTSRLTCHFLIWSQVKADFHNKPCFFLLLFLTLYLKLQSCLTEAYYCHFLTLLLSSSPFFVLLSWPLHVFHSLSSAQLPPSCFEGKKEKRSDLLF